jgi:N-acetylneuraminic acid mutarotase
VSQRAFKTWFAVAGAVALIGCTQLKTVPSALLSPIPSPSPGESEAPSDDPASADPSASPSPSESPSPAVVAPKVTLTGPTANSDFTGTSLDIIFNVEVAEGRKVVDARISYDSEVLATYNANAATYRLDKWNPQVLNSASNNTTAAKFGDHTLSVVVKDDKGTEGKAELKFYKPLRLGTWTAITDLPGPLAHAQAFSDGAFPSGYLLPWGIATDPLEPVTAATGAYDFNPSGDGSWTKVALTGTSAPRAAYGSTVHPTSAGKVYLIGGRSGASDLRTIELFSPLTRQAEQSLASMTNARQKPAAAIVDNVLYVFGGRRATTALTSVERVKLDTTGAPSGTFEAMADAPTARVGGHAIAVGKEIWLIGGGFKAIEVYDTTKNEWKGLQNAAGATIGTPETWSDALMIPASGRYYFFGGVKEDGNAVTSIQEFDPTAKTWRRLGDLPAVTGVTDAERPEAAMSGCYDNGAFYLMGGLSLPDKTLSKKVFRAPAL